MASIFWVPTNLKYLVSFSSALLMRHLSAMFSGAPVMVFGQQTGSLIRMFTG